MKKDIGKIVEDIQPGVDFVKLYRKKILRGNFVALVKDVFNKYFVVAYDKDSNRAVKKAEEAGYSNSLITFVQASPNYSIGGFSL